MICELCNREILPRDESNHHLVPKMKGGKNGDIVVLHEVCHKQIHTLLTEHQLANIYNTVGKLKDHRDIRRFIRWIGKKPIDFNIKVKMSKK